MKSLVKHASGGVNFLSFEGFEGFAEKKEMSNPKPDGGTDFIVGGPGNNTASPTGAPPTNTLKDEGSDNITVYLDPTCTQVSFMDTKNGFGDCYRNEEERRKANGENRIQDFGIRCQESIMFVSSCIPFNGVIESFNSSNPTTGCYEIAKAPSDGNKTYFVKQTCQNNSKWSLLSNSNDIPKNGTGTNQDSQAAASNNTGMIIGTFSN